MLPKLVVVAQYGIAYSVPVPGPPPLPIGAQPVALPFAKTPTGACPVGHNVGVVKSDEAVGALNDKGKSAATSARMVGVPDDPFGEARKRFCVAGQIAMLMLPDIVIGVLVMHNTEPAVASPTAVTVPLPPPPPPPDPPRNAE